jgi:hypothetical protein
MTSFDCRLEPLPGPRLAVAALMFHAGIAASPWLLGVPDYAAALLSAVALLGLPSTLSCLPGPHHSVVAIALEGGHCRVWLARRPEPLRATLGAGSRALAGLVFLDLRTASGRHAWLLTRSCLPPGLFRRLKARVRLSC